MKKICFLIVMCFISFVVEVSAQNPSFSPAVFSAKKKFTLTIDVTGTQMEGQQDAYIWIFSNTSAGGNPSFPPKDGFTNTAWSNSPDTAKMVLVAPNKWSYTLTGTTMFSQTPGELKDFGFLVKAKDGSKQTKDYKPFAFDPLVFVPKALRIFPAKVDKDDIVTLNFERTLGTTTNENRMTPTSVTVTLFDDNNTQVGQPKDFPVKQVTPNIWNGSFVPTDNFTAASGRKLSKFLFKFNGTILDATGATTNVTSSESEVIFTTLK